MTAVVSKATSVTARTSEIASPTRRSFREGSPGDERPRLVALDVEGDVEQELLGEVASDHLQADREAVDQAGGYGDARVPVQVCTGR